MVFVSSGTASPRYGGPSPYASALGAAAPRPFVVAASSSTLRDFAELVVRLREGIGLVRGASTLRLGPSSFPVTSVTASAALDPATAAALSSTEEVNTTPTSYSPREASLGSADAELSGTYDGSLGDDQLTFRVSQGGVLGLTTVRVEVLDGGGSQVEELDFGLGYTDGTPVATSFGLSLALSGSVLSAGDSFQADVSASVGAAVDPDAAFDGTGNDDPGFDSGQSVGAGTLTINGVGVAVLASDSLNDVLARITASAAGVTATFDAASEGVVLTQNTAGPAPTIALGSDDSGFFDATKLSGATVVAGEPADVDRTLDQVAAFAGVTAGDLLVNGVSIAVDPALDTLSDLVDRINAAGAGATASLAADDRLRIDSDDASGLVLGDGSSGFFTATGIGEVEETVPRPARRRFARPSELRGDLDELARLLRRAFAGERDVASSVQADLALSAVRAAVSEAYAEVARDPDADLLRSGFGIDFDFRDPSKGILQVDGGKLQRALVQDVEDLAAFLLDERDEDGRDGLLTALEAAFAQAGANVAARLGDGAGLILDALA